MSEIDFIRTLGGMFVEPIFAMILGDFVVRLCILRNERAIAQKLEPVNILIGSAAVLRLLTTIPYMF